jgi:hypothetical protein
MITKCKSQLFLQGSEVVKYGRKIGVKGSEGANGAIYGNALES